MFRNLIFRFANRQIHFVSTTKIIKPASPTPPSQKHYNLSPIDQFTPRNYIPIVFYYPNKLSNDLQVIGHLKRSLSETLVQYYPFAGRLNSVAYVDCNDVGVEFQEVNIKRHMSEILEKSDQEEEALDLVFPNGLVWGNVNPNSPLLVIRLANFECGGVSIAVCLSHKLGDAKSFETFMKSWASKTRRITNHSSTNLSEDIMKEYSPHFISYPSTDNDNIVPEFPLPRKDWATRRFLFPNSKINKLKEMVASKSGLGNTSRVEVVCALLYKRAVAATTANSGFFTPTVLTLSVNMRPKMIPPLPEMSMGNFHWQAHIPTTNDSDTNINVLVQKIKKAKMDTDGMKKLEAAEYMSKIIEFARNGYNFFMCSSLCGMQFCQVDFGWGNPSRVAIGGTPSSNGFILTDTPNRDGIEALVSLEEQNMIAFQRDKEIMDFV